MHKLFDIVGEKERERERETVYINRRRGRMNNSFIHFISKE